MPTFDSSQEKDGINKFGHYQFGSQTCPYCKNPDTQLSDKATKEKPRRYCFMCKADWLNPPYMTEVTPVNV